MNPRHLTTRMRPAAAALVLLGGLAIAGVGAAAAAERLDAHHGVNSSEQPSVSIEGKITSIFANTVTVRTDNGLRQVAASPATTISAGDTAGGPASIAVGSWVEVAGTQRSSGTPVWANHIDVNAADNVGDAEG